MLQKIELKVNFHSQKCKTQVLQKVTKLAGIDKVSVDGKKGTLTVIGEVDPVLLTTQVRKTGKVAEIIRVGPPNSPKKTPKSPPCYPFSPHYYESQLVDVRLAPYDDRFCSIL